MSQKERDRLKVLTEAQKGLITQAQAGSQLDISERQVRRLIRKLRAVGDRAVVHGLRGRPSNRRIEAEVEKWSIEQLPARMPRLRANIRGRIHQQATRSTRRQRHGTQVDDDSGPMAEP